MWKNGKGRSVAANGKIDLKIVKLEELDCTKDLSGRSAEKEDTRITIITIE